MIDFYKDSWQSKYMNWFAYTLLAAVLLGIYNFLQRFIDKSLLASVLIGIGAGLAVTGLVIGLLGKKAWSVISSQTGLAVIIGLILGIAIFLINKAFADPKGTVAKIVPLMNTNTLVAVFLGLIILKEYQTVSIVRVLVGALLIVAGGVVLR